VWVEYINFNIKRGVRVRVEFTGAEKCETGPTHPVEVPCINSPLCPDALYKYRNRKNCYNNMEISENEIELTPLSNMSLVNIFIPNSLHF